MRQQIAREMPKPKPQNIEVVLIEPPPTLPMPPEPEPPPQVVTRPHSAGTAGGDQSACAVWAWMH